jgi:hypothetical protein
VVRPVGKSTADAFHTLLSLISMRARFHTRFEQAERPTYLRDPGVSSSTKINLSLVIRGIPAVAYLLAQKKKQGGANVH